jgi:hypothetical protein
MPTKNRQKLIGDVPLPSMTLVNGNPARLDKYGRIWSPFLRNKFHVGARVKISKAENGFLIETSEKKV